MDNVKTQKFNVKKIFKILSPYLFILPYMIFFITFCLVPVILTIILSFTDCADDISVMKWNNFDNYKLIFNFKSYTGEYYWKAMGHTLLFVGVQVPILIIVPFLIAYLLNFKLKGFSIARALIYFPGILSITTVGIIFIIFLDSNTGIFNLMFKKEIPWLTSQPYQWISIFLLSTWWGIGGNMILFTAGLQNIPKELYEAADIDGANSFKKVIYVTLPSLANTFSYVIVMTILSCFNVMGQPMVLTPGTASTEVVIQNIYNTAFGANKYGRASTMSLILAAIMGVFSLLSLKVALNKGGSNNEKH